MNKPSRPKIVLFVENISEHREVRVRMLQNRGYTVVPVATAAEAIECARNQWIHLAVIDARLIDDNDPLDQSGIQLALDLNQFGELKFYPLILYTSFKPQVVVDVFERSARKAVPSNIRIFSKQAIDIGEMVDDAFRLDKHDGMNLVGINFDQTLKYDYPLWRLGLPGLLKQRPSDNVTAVAWADELEDLFGKAFHAYDTLKIAQLPQAVGFILIVSPTRDQEALAPFIVKCGRREAIYNEYQRYKEHVHEHHPQFVALIEEDPTYTLHFGLLKYRIAEGDVENMSTFADFYRQNSFAKVQSTIQHLFSEAEKAWYHGAASRHLPDRLLTFYQERLLVRSSAGAADWPSRWAQLKKSITSVVESTKRMEAVTVEERDARLHWSFGGIKLELPEPHQFLSEIADGQRMADLFPAEYPVRRCHGDLHAGNILVDDKASAWLIDFEHTGWGPPLQDPIELESSIHFGLITERNLERLLRFEQILGEQFRLAEPARLPEDFKLQEPEDHDLRHAFEVIMALRREASRIDIKIVRLADYFLGLIVQALRIIQSDQSPRLVDPQRLPYLKIQALFLASVNCQRLEQLGTPPNDIEEVDWA